MGWGGSVVVMMGSSVGSSVAMGSSVTKSSGGRVGKRVGGSVCCACDAANPIAAMVPSSLSDRLMEKEWTKGLQKGKREED